MREYINIKNTRERSKVELYSLGSGVTTLAYIVLELIFLAGQPCKFVKENTRPTVGTTVISRGFLRSNRNDEEELRSIKFVIARLALTNTEVSFSVRDDTKGRIVFGISKSHSVADVLSLIFNERYPLNNRPIRCISNNDPLKLKVSGSFIEHLQLRETCKLRIPSHIINITALRAYLRSWKKYSSLDERCTKKFSHAFYNHYGKDMEKIHRKIFKKDKRDRRSTLNLRIRKTVDVSADFKLKDRALRANSLTADNVTRKKKRLLVATPIETFKEVPRNGAESTPLPDETECVDISSWSNWTYRSKEETHSRFFQEETINISNRTPKITRTPENKPDTRDFKCLRLYDFLPAYLDKLLPNRKRKLLNRQSLQCTARMGSVTRKVPQESFKEARHRQDFIVRGCRIEPIVREFHFNENLLQSIEVINQMNREFIVAHVTREKERILVLLDQHAVHERIRYEELLRCN
ncbi:uncharacterized protein LOC105699808 isoform X2 [Orussus abietinus]|uniref:uncharacterized protein LOC105699808 isoform X2 n=1 Tax=Orussus abietinus TaxID=222816 RepID=UPI000626DF2B|nr:uncharacterized protein LOC105699808 isoform X2 [Orussus abietinus]